MIYKLMIFATGETNEISNPQWGQSSCPHPIMNPPDAEGKVNNHKSFGVNMMRQMLELGTLHINENCQDFMREARNYYVDEKGRFSDPDDCIDSARYALLACLNDWAEPYDGKTPRQRMMEYKSLYRKESNDNKPNWKRTYSPEGGMT